MTRAVALLGGMFLAALLLAACGGGEEANPTPTPSPAVVLPSPTDEPTPEPTPEPAETLAFIRDGDIWLVNVDGSNERRLNLRNVQSFAWVSADEIDVVTGDDPPRHLLVDLEGSVRDLRFPAGGSWSRDGTQYVVAVDQEIVVFDREGVEVAYLKVRPPPFQPPPKERECGETDPLVFSQPAFSPDGQRVLVAVECSLATGATGNLYASVYETSLDGAVERTLPLGTNLEDMTMARFSPDGSRVAQAIRFGGSACASELVLSVAESDGDTSTELTLPAIVDLRGEPRTEIAGGVYGYDWSPDSDTVVASIDVSVCRSLQEEPFVEVEQILAGLYLFKLGGRPEEQLVEDPTRSPAWAPSGQYIAFEAGNFGEPPEPPTIRLLDLTTREVIDLAQGSQPAWQPQP